MYSIMSAFQRETQIQYMYIIQWIITSLIFVNVKQRWNDYSIAMYFLMDKHIYIVECEIIT